MRKVTTSDWRLKHGYSPRGMVTPTYRSWIFMRRFARAKNIPIVDNWDDFSRFVGDMGERPSGKLLGRLDNTKAYEPSNCRWMTRKEQQNNRKDVLSLTFQGRTLTVPEWADITGIHRNTLKGRVALGWSARRVLLTPIGATTKSTTLSHGHSRGGAVSPTYSSWMSMRNRCQDLRDRAYRNYAARGIKVCARWHQFDNFLADMGERPPGTTLDRFPNNDGNYEPGNCRWATPKQQANNARFNVFIEFNGQRHTAMEWSELTGIKRHMIISRLRHGWTAEEIFMGKKVPQELAS